MIKYDISEFVNDDIDYPFYILDKDGNLVCDFWSVINVEKERLCQNSTDKLRFIWIDADDYCQTEVFLKRLLKVHASSHPILYLHWIDYADEENTLSEKIQQIEIDNKYFIEENAVKICVIDHVETIHNIANQCIEMTNDLIDKKCIFIFLSKNENAAAGIERWKMLNQKIRNERLSHNSKTAWIRSENNYYTVKPYSIEICKEIIVGAINNSEIKCKCISIVNSLNLELRRPYYFDWLIYQLRKYNNPDEVPSSYDDTTLMESIYSEAKDGIISHLIGASNGDNKIDFKKYINAYFESGFVKGNALDIQKRIPFDNYALAYGIIKCGQSTSVSDKYSLSAIRILYETIGIEAKKLNKEQLDRAIDINIQVVKIVNKLNIKYQSESNFKLQKYLLQLSKYSRFSALVSAKVLNSCIDILETDIKNNLFCSICSVYEKDLKDESELYTHAALGIEIGNLMQHFGNESISKGLSLFFKEVTDEYIFPNCNEHGISVIPVTNIEFQKFVKDGGYEKYYYKMVNGALKDIAVEYYKDIFDFVIDALSGNNLKNSRCLAKLLKGHDLSQYKHIAYLYSYRKYITNDTISNEIRTINYPDLIQYPAKWADKSNSQTRNPFCNPLQPVVCVNLFEARAYSHWLSDKIKKSVRVLKYDPDYISIIGLIKDNKEDEQRKRLRNHLKQNLKYINTSENSVYFYEENDGIMEKEPSPVAVPNSIFDGIYDFVGNVFETQDTLYKYNATVNHSDEIISDFNCPGGGLQRNKSNWPPDYMGQVPAFLRNQDIGFRIVIDGAIEGISQHKDRVYNSIEYAEESEFEELFAVDKSSEDNCLFKYIELNDEDTKFRTREVKFDKGVIYKNGDCEVCIYSTNRLHDHRYSEHIMLVGDHGHIFAYHLIDISAIKRHCKNNCIIMHTRTPNLPLELSLKKKCQNRCFAKWIDLVQIHGDGEVNTCLAYPMNICNGYFSIPKRKTRKKALEGRECKTISYIAGSYRISFQKERMDIITKLYNNIGVKLKDDYFLPDWIDIIDFIKYLSGSIFNEVGQLNMNTVMAAITTIDTADLHEQINLNKKGVGSNNS